jgi:anti-sigma factor RsiW
MKVLTCAATRRRLDAYHDEELTISEQIAVSSHLEWCDGCAEVLDDLRQLRDALRQAMPGRVALSTMTVEEDLNLQATVVSRIKAEERLSFGAWLQDAFADMHLVYAGLSAVAAAIACPPSRWA